MVYSGLDRDNLVGWGKFWFHVYLQCELALSSVPRLRYSFDSDNDVAAELVYSDEDQDGELDRLIKRESGEWTIAQARSVQISDELFRDSRWQRRFEKLAAMGGGAR